MSPPTVALGCDFLDAFARIPRSQQKKVGEFIEKFQANPKSAAIHYEKIHGVKDDKVRTVRIDQKYRAVILHPEKGDVHVLVWVDNHDEAMDWARKRTFDINPVTGALQIVNVVEAQQVVPPEAPKKHKGFLEAYEDDVLLSFGLPAALLPAVRAVQTGEELLALMKFLPAEAAEALTWLTEGIPVEEVRSAVMVASAKQKVDTGDLAAALENPDTRRRFVTIKSADVLSSMLDAPLAKWRVFLHPSQEKLATKHFNGPARVTGGAGTGKTVVAMHRARSLARDVFTAPTDRILFTTLTANLAQNVEQNLRGLCGEEMGRIEVLHLHSWATRYMKTKGVDFRIATGDEIDQCWDTAVAASGSEDFDVGFLKQEWDQVVEAHGIHTQSEYLKVPRTGRGRTLSKPQRGQVWKIFEKYRQALRDRGKQEWLQAIQETRRYLEAKKDTLPYQAVVIDEGQDFHPEEWKLLRAIVPPGPNDLFIVGDAHQRIYGRKVFLSNYGIQIQGRSSTLKINYRTTEQIRDWAVAMLRGMEVDDLDGKQDDEGGYKSLLSGPKPEARHFASLEQEQEFLAETIREYLQTWKPEEICLVARTGKQLERDYQTVLKKMKVPFVVLDKTNEGKDEGIRLATMHRVKGLEFPVMLLAGVNSKVVPMYLSSVEGDPTARAEHEGRERSLLFVAATRARDKLVVTSWGIASPFLPKMTEGAND